MRTAGLVVFVIGVGIPLPSLSQELSNLPTAEVPPEALAGPVERPARAASRHPKLDSVLAEVAAEAAVSRERAIDKASASRIPSRANRVQVEVAMDPAAAASVL